MTKKTTTTVTEKFDKDGKITERVTETVTEEKTDYCYPYYPYYPYYPSYYYNYPYDWTKYQYYNTTQNVPLNNGRVTGVVTGDTVTTKGTLDKDALKCAVSNSYSF